MKRIFLTTAAVLISATAASAADLAALPYTKAPAYAPAPIYNWTGFYIGGHIGGAFGGSNNVFAPGIVGFRQ
jgi:outer membrane immunogenic protein